MIERKLAYHLKNYLHQYPVVTMTGPRQSGKTTLSRMALPDYEYVNLEDLETRNFALSDPKGFLARYSRRPGVILDEIQRAPDLPSYIQAIVDDEKINGRFVLTGSQQFEVSNSINQSLAGRTALIKLLPFSYQELYGSPRSSQAPDINSLIYYGFYPRIHDQSLEPTSALSFYFSTYVERDIRSLKNIQNLSLFERFTGLCAGAVGQLINSSRFSNDLGVDQKTVNSWLSLLEASYIVFRLRPHSNNLRKRFVKTPKLYFYDVGLACYLLGITSAEQINHHPLRGALFENLVISEFLKERFNSSRDNNLYFARDHVGNEVDLIIENGISVTAVEIKSSQTISKDSFKGLEWYYNLTPESIDRRHLVYAGESSKTWSGINVTPISGIGEV